ncbi:MAG: CAP domain-containing protein, partial [Oscillospiraceae bacterium]|nr:CAP domain-containing protein [Oscillospiraceae bacterium]
NTQLPWYGTANGSGTAEYPEYPQTQQTQSGAQLTAGGYFGQPATGASCVTNGRPCVIGTCPNSGYCPSGGTSGSGGYQYPSYAPPTSAPTQNSGILAQADPATPTTAAIERESLALLNYERQSNGLSTLQMDPTLNILARLKSQDMAENNYFAHESDTYGKAADMLDAAGFQYTGVGENIAHHENAYTANAAFMSSAGHRANILGSQWTKAGVGVALDNNGYPLITQIFAR